MWQFTGSSEGGRWTPVEVPVSASLHDVAGSAKGPVAVGNGGAVVARAAGGEWGVVVPNGPSARGESLYAIDATDDGKRVWFAGANGALGCYEVHAGRRRDRSEPDGITDAFGNVAVSGARGEEKLLVADRNGAVYAAEVLGARLRWEREYRPAGDTALTGLAAAPDGVGYAVDSNANVWRTTRDEGWTDAGVDGAENSFYAIAAGEETVLVGGGNGRVYRSSDGASSWTPFTLGSFTVRALAVGDGTAVAGGTNGTIATYRGRWRTDGWAGSKTVNGVRLGDVDVAVCNGGVALERPADGRRSASSTAGDGSKGS